MERDPGHVVGIDLGGTKILSICVDAGLDIVGQDTRPTEADKGPDTVIERMVASALAAAGGRSLLGAGVSTPGPTDPTRGIVTTPPNLPGWRDVPLARLISDKLGVPAWIENDANAGALAEHRTGAGRGTSHMVLVAAGTGVGGGLILDGKLFHGASGGAGEIGHIQLDPAGRPCSCGSKGCLEALASGWSLTLDAQNLARAEPDGLVAQIARREGVEPDPRILDLAIEAGDAGAEAVVRRAGAYLGAGFTSLVNVLNPEAIVIGGSLRKSRVYVETAIEVLKREAFAQHLADVRVAEAELGDEAPAMGAALIALESLATAPHPTRSLEP